MRALFALIHVMLCQILAGVSNNEWCRQITLTHLPGQSGQTTATIWAIALSSGSAQNPIDISWTVVNGTRATITGGKFEFALQTGFTGDVLPGDKITDGDDVYKIKQVLVDQSQAIYMVDCTDKKARMLGVA